MHEAWGRAWGSEPLSYLEVLHMIVYVLNQAVNSLIEEGGVNTLLNNLSQH